MPCRARAEHDAQGASLAGNSCSRGRPPAPPCGTTLPPSSSPSPVLLPPHLRPVDDGQPSLSHVKCRPHLRRAALLLLWRSLGVHRPQAVAQHELAGLGGGYRNHGAPISRRGQRRLRARQKGGGGRAPARVEVWGSRNARPVAGAAHAAAAGSRAPGMPRPPASSRRSVTCRQETLGRACMAVRMSSACCAALPMPIRGALATPTDCSI